MDMNIATLRRPSPAPMTSRMVVMMSPDDKRAIETRARALDITPSELVRRAAAGYEPGALEIEAMAAELEAHAQAMRAALGDAVAHAEGRLAEIAALRAAR